MEILSWCYGLWSLSSLYLWSWFGPLVLTLTVLLLVPLLHTRFHSFRTRRLGSLFYLWILVSTVCDSWLIGVTGFFAPTAVSSLPPYLARLDSDFLLPHAFPPSGFDSRLLILDHAIALTPSSTCAIHRRQLRFASSTYPLGRQIFRRPFRFWGEIRRKHLRARRRFELWETYVNNLTDTQVASQLFETFFVADSPRWTTLIDSLGFDTDSEPFIPKSRYLHLTGFGTLFDKILRDHMFTQAPFCSVPQATIRHPDDLEIHELGDDFSNLLRFNCMTPTTYSKLFNLRLDPTMHLDPSINVGNDPLLQIILDTGASHGLTMSTDDFVELTYGNFGAMSTAANENKFPIIGAGIVAYDAISENGDLLRWTFPANLCKAAGTRLCSPQVCADYLNLDRRFPSFESNHVFASIKTDAIGGRLTVPIDHSTNLPLVKAKNVHKQPNVISHNTDPSCKCGNANWCQCPLQQAPSRTTVTLAEAFHQQQGHPSELFSDNNRNLTTAQKHLLLDHQRLGHLGMRRIQNLYHCQEISPESCLKPRTPGCLNCPLPKCHACLLGKARRRPSKATVKTPRPDAGHIPTDRSKLEPGGLVSIDHFESSVRGRLYNTRGRERPEHRFCGGTLFFDHASRAIFVYPQVSLGGSDTIRSKFTFETFASQVGRTICRHHTDNGILTSTAFEKSLRADRVQTPPPLHTVSGVGAHHQNGGAERAIQTVTSMARTMMIHCHLHWPDGFSPTLWPMALDYATWIYNHTPTEDSTLSPIEIFTGLKEPCTQLRRLRVWGCPSYVLDPRIQDGKKLPNWNSRARQGQFLGFSNQHLTTVGLIRNLTTNHISPQFHVVHDELFHTVHSNWTPPSDGADFPDFVTRDHYLEDHDSSIDGPLPPLDPSWLPPSDSNIDTMLPPSDPQAVEGEQQPQPQVQTEFPLGNPPGHDLEPTVLELDEPELEPPPPPPVEPGEPQLEPVDETGEPELELPNETGEPQLEPLAPRRSRRNRPQTRRFPDPERHVRFDLPSDDSSWSTHCLRHHSTFAHDANFFLSTTSVNHDASTFATMANALDWTHWSDPDLGEPCYLNDRSFSLQATTAQQLIDDWDPRYFASKSFDADNPSYFDLPRMTPEEQEKWFIAMDRELDELEGKGTFRLVPRSNAKGKEIVDTMWTLKRKRLPDGTISRYKARLVVRGDQQKATFDKEDTFAPVIDWPSVRLLLILSLQHNLVTASIDFKNAFVQSSLPEPIYVNLPSG